MFLANPYIVHTMTNIESSDEELPEPSRRMQDNLCRQDVEIDPSIISDNIVSLLHFLNNPNEYDDNDHAVYIQIFLHSFNLIFQVTSETDYRRWHNIDWNVHTNGVDKIEATGYENDNMDLSNHFCFEFFKQGEKQMLRVHYEGQIDLERIQETRG